MTERESEGVVVDADGGEELIVKAVGMLLELTFAKPTGDIDDEGSDGELGVADAGVVELSRCEKNRFLGDIGILIKEYG